MERAGRVSGTALHSKRCYGIARAKKRWAERQIVLMRTVVDSEHCAKNGDS
jgi:hypothetical protein